MRNSLPQFVLGYHGCDLSLVRQLLNAETQLKFSRNSYDWLGSGIYFWENAPCRAMDWALECQKNSRITKGKVIEPAVIGVILDLGNCLNLTDSRHQDVIREAYRGICDLCAAQSEQLPKNTEKSRKLDCAVINAAVELNKEKGYPDFDSIRSPYFEGEPIYPSMLGFVKSFCGISDFFLKILPFQSKFPLPHALMSCKAIYF